MGDIDEIAREKNEVFSALIARIKIGNVNPGDHQLMMTREVFQWFMQCPINRSDLQFTDNSDDDEECSDNDEL